MNGAIIQPKIGRILRLIVVSFLNCGIVWVLVTLRKGLPGRLCDMARGRFFLRGNYYTVHGDDCEYVARHYVKTDRCIQLIGPKPNPLPSCIVNAKLFDEIVSDLWKRTRCVSRLGLFGSFLGELQSEQRNSMIPFCKSMRGLISPLPSPPSPCSIH